MEKELTNEKPVFEGIAKAVPGILKEEWGGQDSWSWENTEESSTYRRWDHGGDGEPDNLQIFSPSTPVPRTVSGSLVEDKNAKVRQRVQFACT